jgi:hypothetical protein
MQGVPRASQGTFPDNLGGDGGVGGDQSVAVEIDAVFVGEGGVGSFPGCDAAATGPQGKGGFLEIEGAEAVQEVGLACYDGVVEIGIA